jgi:hypothetical protein
MAIKTILSDLSQCGIEPFAFAGFTFPRHVATLETGPIASRLAYRKARCTGNYYHAPKPGATGRGFYLGKGAHGAHGLRWQYADDAATTIRHTGWFCDDFQDSKIRGIVLRLPRGRGFLAGWTMGVGMASSFDYSPIFDDERDAAFCADRMAESAAESEREYQERENQRMADEELELSALGTDE